MQVIGQFVGCGALVSLFVLFMTEDERIARACLGYLKAFALLATLAVAAAFVAQAAS